MIVRLILGDQLHSNHSWYTQPQEDVCYFMAEMRQETDYTKHHIQKVIAFFLGMRAFAKTLQARQFNVIYYDIHHPDNTQKLTTNLEYIIRSKKATKFEYQLPDEYRLDQQLKTFCDTLSIPSEAVDTEHFLTSRTDLADFFKGKKQYTMEYFYRHMRKRYDIMMFNDTKPEGGQWNFDQRNRNKWTAKHPIPDTYQHPQDVTKVYQEIQDAGIETIGRVNKTQFNWPTTRATALQVLDYFCEQLLVHFGTYQDAMHTDEKYLYHSRLSFAMNSKLLHPMEVIQTAIAHWRAHQEQISIAQIEGFVRQILGWREYMRGMYWAKMPEYKTLNTLENHNPLPEFYWTGNTKMNCLHHAITQSLEDAYAHHIQRLMITGNYALLTQTDPDAVDQWYLGIYIDAIEWVEITNTRGMSQYADGGLIATKPYVSSGSYINKMSNYCRGCHYKVSKKTEDDACPFNALYWNFLAEKESHFKKNQRMTMMLSVLHKMKPEKLKALQNRAQHIIQHPDTY